MYITVSLKCKAGEQLPQNLYTPARMIIENHLFVFSMQCSVCELFFNCRKYCDMKTLFFFFSVIQVERVGRDSQEGGARD